MFENLAKFLKLKETFMIQFPINKLSFKLPGAASMSVIITKEYVNLSTELLIRELNNFHATVFRQFTTGAGGISKIVETRFY